MKKLLLSLAIVMCASVGVKAQGNIWVGGSLGVNSTKTDGSDRTTGYAIMPEIGMGLTDNLGIGIQLGYGHGETNVENILGGGFYKEKFDKVRVQPFVRYKFLQGDLGSLFVDGGAAYEYRKIKDGAKTNAFEVGFKPGVMINVSDRFALIGKFGSLGYKYAKQTNKGPKTNSFGFNLNPETVELGINFVF